MHIPILYVPSFYGDISLKPDDNCGEHTRVFAERTSPREKDALSKLAEFATKKKWLDHTLDMKAEGETIIRAPLLKVQESLVKFLKPGRTMITAVTFADGAMQEVSSSTATVASPSTPVAPAVAATAVAKPTQGCPAPAFERADVKARAVLEAFLTEEQKEDFRKHNRFISVGAFTGHRYMVTSRYANDSLARYQRSLFDLDENRPYCVHDWVVPPAEEMLALHVMLQLPGHEPYLRHLEN